MLKRGQAGILRVGTALVFAAVGCGGTALEGGGDAGGGSTAASAHSDPPMAAPPGPASSTVTGTAGSPGVYVSPGYGDAGGAPSYREGDPGGYGPSYAGGGYGPVVGVAGLGGVGGITEGGGAGYADADCSSPPTGQAFAPWQPQTVGEEPVAQVLADAHAKLSGNWRGIVTSQFVPAYSIVLSFQADGSYSARCSQHSDFDGSSPGCCRALYYGTDQDTPLKQWTLTSTDATGSTSGDLDIIYAYPPGFGESGYQGRISNLQFDAAGLRARFTFVYGDITVGTYDLERTP